MEVIVDDSVVRMEYAQYETRGAGAVLMVVFPDGARGTALCDAVEAMLKGRNFPVMAERPELRILNCSMLEVCLVLLAGGHSVVEVVPNSG